MSLHVNGRFSYYGSDFADIPFKRFSLNSGSITVNLKAGDIFKVSSPYWKNTLGYGNLKDSPYFDGEWDGFYGVNICCLMDGRYLITVSGETIEASLVGDIEDENSLWQIVGNLSRYPDNNWGRGENKLFLRPLSENSFHKDYSPELYNCYYNEEPVFLEKNDEFKLGILRSADEWVKPAGASLLVYKGDCGAALEDDLGFGDNVGGANIRVNTPGKYIFYLYVNKEDTSDYRILWSRTY